MVVACGGEIRETEREERERESRGRKMLRREGEPMVQWSTTVSGDRFNCPAVRIINRRVSVKRLVLVSISVLGR
ncbi:hypothetical protein HanIR_Chr06g0287111 [Helianthus annuus]|nr:hypothetical protein HanIR_Chr06g0287111 [Helianthus annuus]